MSEETKRPFGVTLVGFIIFVVGALGVIVGILGLIQRDQFPGTLALSAIIATLVIGVIYLLVGKGIFSGNRGSRFLVGLFTVLNLVAGIIAAITPGRLISGLVQILLSVIILGLLYNSSAKRFFG
ncbi:MAG: hypothetical protein ACKOE2_04815 [Actinomycetales bacterium]